MTTVTDLLLAMPHPARVLAANVVAYRLDRQRRAGRAYVAGRGLIEEYRKCEWNDLEKRQHRLLLGFLERIKHRIPFYRERIPGGTAADVASRLASIPPLTKDEARLAGKGLIDSEMARDRHFVGRTSGSTGTPFVFRLTYDALRCRVGIRDGFYELHGFDFGELNLRLGGRLFVRAARKRPPFWLRDHVANQVLFSIYHFSEGTMPYFVEALEKYNPRYITGYPSAVQLLASGCRDLGSRYRPKGVFTDSETVLDAQRALVREVWGCEIHDYYGMEVGWVAGQCARGAYHISPLTSVVEVLDEGGNALPPGVPGEIVVTDLTNPLMPLVRYRTGDLAVWSDRECGCGWHTPTLERIEGRMDDLVILPDGRKIGRLDHILKSAANIREAQLVQEKLDRFVLYVVPEQGFDRNCEDHLRRDALARLGRGVSFEIRRVHRLDKTRTGKLRSVVSLVGNGDGGNQKDG